MTKKVEKQLESLSSSIQETILEDLREQLETFRARLNRLPSPTAPPRTTLQIQGRAATEAAWQQYLGYFLDPSAPHGLGSDALNRFLEGLGEHTERHLPSDALRDVDVVTEQSSHAGNRPDLIIRDRDSFRFFVCCELKLYSPETRSQTKRYVEDDQIGQDLKEEFPERGHHYAYIRRRGSNEARADQFVNVTWRQVRAWLEPLLHTSRGRYPARTTAQLSDFLDTIRQDMMEDKHLQTKREKMNLYFEHLDAIQEAKDGLITIHEHERANWRRRFLEEYLPETWTEEWHCNPNKYGQFYHSEWRQEEGLQADGGRVKMHFVHLIRNVTSFEEGKLTVQLRWPGKSNRYKERFKALFVSDRFASKLDPRLGEYDITKAPNISRSNPRLTGKVYDVDRSGLPESYYETLSIAVKEHQQIAPVINEVLQAAIRDVEKDLSRTTTKR